MSFGVNVFFVLTFWAYSHFSPYFSILLFLIPKMKNAFHFGSYLHFTNRNCLHVRQSALLAY